MFQSDLKHKSDNAMKKYVQTKPPPSAESVRRAKQNYSKQEPALHPYFKSFAASEEESKVLSGLKSWRPQATIFELNIGSKNQGAQVMKAKRKNHQRTIVKRQEMAQKKAEDEEKEANLHIVPPENIENVEANEEEIVKTFNTVLTARKFNPEANKKPKKRKLEEEKQKEKEENYLSYTPSDMFTEQALQVNSNFEKAAQEVSIDINADDDKGLYKAQHKKKW